MLDFIIKAKKNSFRILQLTDMQIIDAEQRRYPERLREFQIEKWNISHVNECVFNDMDEVVRATEPDLIIVTGDIVYGSFDDLGTSLKLFVDKMESYEIPWAPVWGNHDNESKMGVDWQISLFTAAKHCLFKKGDTVGTSNYTVGVCNEKGELARVLYMLDSNGCSASELSFSQGVAKRIGMAEEQLEWMRKVRSSYAEDIPAFACFHVETLDFLEILEARGVFTRECLKNKELFKKLSFTDEGEFGDLHEPVFVIPCRAKPAFKAVGVDGAFFGHAHLNNCSIVDDGIRWTYGLKTGTYDYHEKEKLGGTVIDLALAEKTFTVRHHYLHNSKELNR